MKWSFEKNILWKRKLYNGNDNEENKNLNAERVKRFDNNECTISSTIPVPFLVEFECIWIAMFWHPTEVTILPFPAPMANAWEHSEEALVLRSLENCKGCAALTMCGITVAVECMKQKRHRHIAIQLGKGSFLRRLISPIYYHDSV